MEIPVDDETMWWYLKAGRGGVLETDWLDRSIVLTGWGERGGDFREMTPEEFRAFTISDFTENYLTAGFFVPICT